MWSFLHRFLHKRKDPSLPLITEGDKPNVTEQYDIVKSLIDENIEVRREARMKTRAIIDVIGVTPDIKRKKG